MKIFNQSQLKSLLPDLKKSFLNIIAFCVYFNDNFTKIKIIKLKFF